MKHLYLLIILFGATLASAQEKPREKAPGFPGGSQRAMQFFADSTCYPREAKRNHVQGLVTVKFVLNERGGVDSPFVVKSLGAGCDEEALRVIQAMPLWEPAMQGDRAVKVWFTQPVIFNDKLRTCPKKK